MKKNLLTLLMACYVTISFAGAKQIYTTDIVRDVAKTESQPALMRVSTNVLVEAFQLSSEEAFFKALAAGSVKFLAKSGSKGTISSAVSYGTHGYWFTSSSVVVTAENGNRRVACKYEDGYFHLIHRTGSNLKGVPYVNTGDSYSFTQLFVMGTDTVEYVFNVTMGSAECIDTDQPPYEEVLEHRKDEIDVWKVQPLVRQNEGEWLPQHYIQVMVGDTD